MNNAKLKFEIEKNNKNQRQSALPTITRLLIESSAGVSLAEGIEEFGRNTTRLSKKMADKLKKDLLEGSAFGSQKLTDKQKRILQA